MRVTRGCTRRWRRVLAGLKLTGKKPEHSPRQTPATRYDPPPVAKANRPKTKGKTAANPGWLAAVLIVFFDKWIVGNSREGVCPNVPVYRRGSGNPNGSVGRVRGFGSGRGGSGLLCISDTSLVVHASE